MVTVCWGWVGGHTILLRKALGLMRQGGGGIEGILVLFVMIIYSLLQARQTLLPHTN